MTQTFFHALTSNSLLLALFLCTFNVEAVRATDDAQELKAGAFAIDITPTKLPVETAGSMTPHSTSNIHDPLFARCLVIDNGENVLAMVVVDSCMVPREIFDSAKEQASKTTGIPTSHILCSATHSHSAVCVARVFQSNVDPVYCELLKQKIAEGIATAFKQRETAKIGWAVTSNPQQVFNRRWHLRPGTELNDPLELGTDKVRMNPQTNHASLLKPAGPIDPGVPVISVQAVDGRQIAVWTNYSLHYVGGIPEGGLSGDYFGEFAAQLIKLQNASELKPPMVAAMTNGTSADINNINFFEGRPAQKPFEQIRVVAADLAKTVHSACQRIEYVNWVPITVAEEEVELGVRRPGEKEIARAKELLASAGPAPWRDVKQIYANETLQLSEYPATVKAKLQAIRIGDVGIATTPCETFVETGLAIKEHSPLPITFTVELANGYNGYLPTPEQHALGGYETWRAKSSYLTVDAEPKVRGTLLRLLEKTAAYSTSQKKKAVLDALSKIESTRGGRHWIDEPTAPPKSPEESLACFKTEPGLRIELVAAEPLVFDPVWLAFDQLGRLFVAEYSDYPSGPTDPASAPLCKIVVLTDSDGDGRMDRRHVFADKLDFAHSFMPFREGLLVGAKTEILYLQDTDGDLKADVREVLFRGFHPAHPQMQIGCPVWGFDNWIYMTYGAGDVERLKTSLGSPSAEKIPIRRDFRFNPLTWEFAASSGFGQFGHTIDSVGHRYFCTNRNPIIAAPILPNEFQRNPLISFTLDQYDVSPSGGDSRVFPLVEMKSNYLSHAGTHTAACGTTAYVGDLLPKEFVDSVMVCEPIGHLITRSKVKPSGSILQAERAYPQTEFVASTDRWFRPGSLANGPDGALYIADMYRLWVEHPKFLPPDIAAKIDWRAGEDRGRIWRVVPEDRGGPLPKFIPPKSTADLVQLLSHKNGWQRELAQRLLVERQAIDAEGGLRAVIRTSDDRWALQRALCTLDGLGRIQLSDLQSTIKSQHSNVRKEALRIARKQLNSPEVVELVAKAAGDQDAEVQLECALALGDIPIDGNNNANVPTAGASQQDRIGKALASIALSSTQDTWLASAVLSSSKQFGSEVLTALSKAAEAGSFRSSPTAVRLFRELGNATGASGDTARLVELLELFGSRGEGTSVSNKKWWRYAVLSGLSAGLNRGEIGGKRVSLSSLISDPPSEFAASVLPVANLLNQSVAIAVDSGQPEDDRNAAIELMVHLPKEQWRIAARDLFRPEQPNAVKLAVLSQMRRQSDSTNAELVIENWPSLGPEVRSDAILFLLQNLEASKLALRAMKSSKMDSSIVNIDQRAILLAHPDAEIKELAKSIFGSGISPDRQDVAREYQSALTTSGDAKLGASVFDRVCAACHRFNGRGKEVGPDISDTRNRSREALLYDILDPNQKLEPKYTAYQALTVDGKVYQGILIAETPESIVLQLAEGKQQSIARVDLELFKANGKSLMPEGVEKDVSISQMASLLEFLKSGQ